jgi:hypothetical protein
MLHLFNSCYVYPVGLFDPTKNYLVVGEDHTNKPTLTNSFYYNNSVPKDAFERFDCFENFASSNLLEPVLNNKDLFVIYADNENFIKFFTAKLKTQVQHLTKQFFLDAAKLFAVRLTTRAKLIQSESIRTNIKVLSDMFMALEDIPNVDKFNVSPNWVRYNAGIEWKLAAEDYSTIDNVVNHYVYSFFEEARAKYLSRKYHVNSWAVDPNNKQFGTVFSMKHLYMEMRKEFNTFTDPTILKYYELNDIREMVKDPLFLLLLSANKNMGDKVDIWLLRWLLKMPKEQIIQMGLLT